MVPVACVDRRPSVRRGLEAILSGRPGLKVAGEDFYIDLLLYQSRLRCSVVIERGAARP